MSLLSEPRKPDCEVCGWATAYHYAHGTSVCGADLDLVNKVAQFERERITDIIRLKITPKATADLIIEALQKEWNE